MYPEDDLLPISALQHLAFCERQCMLIHAECTWSENRHTAEGRRLHDRVHAEATRLEGGRLIARGLRLASRRLGLAGMADVVEFAPASQADDGIGLPGRPGRWVSFPVEFKRGRPKKHNADIVQLCAQAMCLEEMLDAAVPAGALFYGRTRHRRDVVFDLSLRRQTRHLAERLHQLFDAGLTPPPEPGPKCKQCSLKPQCLPARPASARAYTRRIISAALTAGTGEP